MRSTEYITDYESKTVEHKCQTFEWEGEVSSFQGLESIDQRERTAIIYSHHKPRGRLHLVVTFRHNITLHESGYSEIKHSTMRIVTWDNDVIIPNRDTTLIPLVDVQWIMDRLPSAFKKRVNDGRSTSCDRCGVKSGFRELVRKSRPHADITYLCEECAADFEDSYEHTELSDTMIQESSHTHHLGEASGCGGKKAFIY